jgi:hypothetical protein
LLVAAVVVELHTTNTAAEVVEVVAWSTRLV